MNPKRPELDRRERARLPQSLVESGLDDSWRLQDLSGEFAEAGTPRSARDQSARLLAEPDSQNEVESEAALDARWQASDLEPIGSAQAGTSSALIAGLRLPHFSVPERGKRPVHGWEIELPDETDELAIDDLDAPLDPLIEDEGDDIDFVAGTAFDEPADVASAPDLEDEIWSDLPALDPEPGLAESAATDPAIDDVLDFSLLGDFDAEARALSESVEVEGVSDLQSRLRRARMLARDHGWIEPEEIAILEEIVRPMRKIGRSLKSIQELIELGITPEELAKTHQFRRIFEGYSTFVDWSSRPKHMTARPIMNRITWREAWELLLMLGPEMDIEETLWLLDRLHSEWYTRMSRQYAGFAEAFSVPDSLRAFLVERVIRPHRDIPFWAHENLNVLVDPFGERRADAAEGVFEDGVWL